MKQQSSQIEPKIGALQSLPADTDLLVAERRANQQKKSSTLGLWLVVCALSAVAGYGYWQQMQQIEQLQQALAQADINLDQARVSREEQLSVVNQQGEARQKLLSAHLGQLKQQVIELSQQQTLQQRELTLVKNQQLPLEQLTSDLTSSISQPLQQQVASSQQALQELSEQLTEQLSEQQTAHQQQLTDLTNALAEQVAQVMVVQQQVQELEGLESLGPALQQLAQKLTEQQQQQVQSVTELQQQLVAVKQDLQQALAQIEQPQAADALAKLETEQLALKKSLAQLRTEVARVKAPAAPSRAANTISQQEFDAYKAQFNRRLAELERR